MLELSEWWPVLGWLAAALVLSAVAWWRMDSPHREQIRRRKGGGKAGIALRLRGR